jgi:hypothetical protein
MKRKAKLENIFYKKDGVIVNFQFKTTNTKTGDLVQNYFIPEAWIQTDKSIDELDDKAVCFDCKHGQGDEATCYVRDKFKSRGLKAKIRGLRDRGLDSIPELDQSIEDTLLEQIELWGKGVRFGSYGEPILLGEDLVEKISKRTKFWTGYTHQWHKNPWAKKYFMASVDYGIVDKSARAMGWRTFFVNGSDGDHVTCPASKEAGYKTTCDKCKLCMGTTSRAKSVKINIH